MNDMIKQALETNQQEIRELIDTKEDELILRLLDFQNTILRNINTGMNFDAKIEANVRDTYSVKSHDKAKIIFLNTKIHSMAESIMDRADIPDDDDDDGVYNTWLPRNNRVRVRKIDNNTDFIDATKECVKYAAKQFTDKIMKEKDNNEEEDD